MPMQENMFFSIHVVVMIVDPGICFLLHVEVIMKVDLGICIIFPSCNNHESGCKNLCSFPFLY